jgi:hypothetical protein
MDADKELLRRAARALNGRDWHWWTSNSYRRLTFKEGQNTRDGGALSAFKNQFDGWPDVAMAPGVQEFIELASPKAVLAMAVRIEELEAALRVPEMDEDAQDWARTSGGVAWHLIDRHANNWAEVGDMMERWARAWVAANPVIAPAVGGALDAAQAGKGGGTQ